MSEVQIVEVSARDGLQNDPARLSTEQKVELIARTTKAGLTRAEIASFVHPRLVPQMADAEAVVAGVLATVGSTGSWIGLVLNTRGFHRAAATGVDEVNCVVGVSDEFSQANQGMSTQDALKVVAEVVPLAREAGIEPTVTLSVAFGCPFSGEVPVSRLAEVAAQAAGRHQLVRPCSSRVHRRPPDRSKRAPSVRSGNETRHEGARREAPPHRHRGRRGSVDPDPRRLQRLP